MQAARGAPRGGARLGALHGLHAAQQAKLERIRDTRKDADLEGCTFNPTLVASDREACPDSNCAASHARARVRRCGVAR